MPRCILFAFALIAAPAFAQPLAPDAGNPPPSPEMPPAQLLAQFHHDEINLLALRGDAHSLLAAALMAQGDAGDPARPKARSDVPSRERACSRMSAWCRPNR